MKLSRKKVFVSHPWIARGGSEATAMWTLDTLQHDFDVTFATAHVDSWDELNAAYGTMIQAGKITIAHCSKLPLVNAPTRLVHLQHRHFERFCQRLAPQFDLCISAYNPVNFGDTTPSLQIIGDFSFSEKMRRKLYSEVHSSFQHKITPARWLYLKLGDIIGIPQHPLSFRKNDLIIANSEWAADQLSTEFDIATAPILYPPVLLPETSAQLEKKPLSFVCLGRISPEKEIEKIIEILRRIRTDHGHEVTLTLIGKLDDSEYSRKIENLISVNSEWITPAGFLTADAKQNLLAEHKFALHGCRIEAFGIAVAEMAALGCVPIVPATGGAREIAKFDELLYHSIDDAIQKILHLIENPAQADDYRNHLKKSVHQFGPATFSAQLRKLVETPIPENHGIPREKPGIVRKIAQRLSDPVFYNRRWALFAHKFRKRNVREHSLDEIPHHRVHVVVAHPDDEVFCSGIICELAKKEGTEVRVICLTRGEGGPLPQGMSRQNLGQKREAEMHESCKILGVSQIQFLDHEDPVAAEFRTYPPDVSRKELAAQLHLHFRDFDPDLVLTHGSWGEYWHPAHLLLHSAVKRAAKGRTVLTFQAKKEDSEIPEITNHADPAHLTFDFSHHFNTRLAALEAHQSQLDLFGHFAKGTHVDFVEKTGRENLSILSFTTIK